MNDPVDLKMARRWFAEDVGQAAPVLHNKSIIEAFATVPREHYLGEGPWSIHSRLRVGDVHPTPSSDARHLYHDVLISIDVESGINNGLPSLWARVFDSLDIKEGATVFQVGAGVGYYTAILAELVSSSGRVIAYEIEADLADRAYENLKHYRNVEVTHGDATQAPTLPALDALVACAGVTHVPDQWLASLKEGGQLMVPMTGTTGWGFLMHLEKRGDALPLRSLGPCGFYPCAGARKEHEEIAINKALQQDGEPPDTARYRTELPPRDRQGAWMAGQSYWISKS